MTIDEAIVSLEDEWVNDPHFDPERRKAAQQLGVEALNRIEQLRNRNIIDAYKPLPGGKGRNYVN